MVESLVAKLNPRAGRFTPKVINAIEQKFAEDARVRIYSGNYPRKEILQERPQVITIGGGDGTIRYESNKIINLCAELGLSFNEQLFAILKLGTGNAISYEVGAGKEHLEQLEMILDTDVNKLPTIQVPLIEITGTDGQGKEEKTYSMLTGAGWDGIILKKYKQSPLNGLAGYFSTIPASAAEVFLGKKLKFEISFPQGAELAEIIEEEIEFMNLPLGDGGRFLQENQIHALVAGTTPYFGYNFVGFPYAKKARTEGKMHLRAVGGNRYSMIPRFVAHTRSIWRGEYRHQDVSEIVTPEVEIALLDKKASAQAGGDHFGEFTRINWKVSDYVLNVVNYNALRTIS
jgi:diacylglycerol kinase family enzyme